MGRLYNYGRLQSTASRLVPRFGAEAELRRGDTETYPTHVVLDDYNSRQIDGTRIMVGDFRALIAATDCATDPRPQDQVYWDGRERTVISVQVVKPGSDTVLYICQMRGPR